MRLCFCLLSFVKIGIDFTFRKAGRSCHHDMLFLFFLYQVDELYSLDLDALSDLLYVILLLALP